MTEKESSAFVRICGVGIVGPRGAEQASDKPAGAILDLVILRSAVDW